LLLLIPVISANYGYNEVTSIITRWKNREQESAANLKLGELSVQVDISQHISAYSSLLRGTLSDLQTQYPDKMPSGMQFSSIASSVFRPPFPKYELLIFSRQGSDDRSDIVFSSRNLASRRSAAIVFDHLLAETLDLKRNDNETRRNEKILRRFFGMATLGRVVANSQRGMSTPVIYDQTPSFLAWDYVSSEKGAILGFFLIVRRNQNLDESAYALGAEKTGIGREFPGGFISIFNSSEDYFFPGQIGKSATLQNWRKSMGTAITDRLKWEQHGFPWAMKLGKHKLYTRVLPKNPHIAFVIMPDLAPTGLPDWLKTLNLFATTLITLMLLRGLLLDAWPFEAISGRFLMAFLLAATLPAVLYIASATAYIYERHNADEKQIEETLTSCLLDFDAGKEYLENAYISLFTQMMNDSQVKLLLEEKGLAAADSIFARIGDIVAASPEKIPISGIALYDITGNARFDAKGNINRDDFVSMAGFYGLPFTNNLRLFASKNEPDLVLPEQKKDPRHVAASQSFRRDSMDIEYEIERFRNRVIKTSIGRGHLEYIYDFVNLKGKSRFTLMIAWLDSEINQLVLKQNAIKLGLSRPEMHIAGFRKSSAGVESILDTDRSITRPMLKKYAQVARSSMSLKSGMVKTLLEDRSIVAYVSSHFENTVLIASLDNYQKTLTHQFRIISFIVAGIFGLIILIFSGVTVYVRVVMPLKRVKHSLDQIDSGLFPNIPSSQRKDEIGVLSSEFSAMVKGLEERQRLASMLSDQALSAISASSDGTRLRSESLSGVVLISDIRNFTSMCEKYDPKTVTRLLNVHFAEMAAVITGFGGRIYKFIGDAIEAVFIDEEGNSKPAALRASLAACSMLLRLQRINQRRQSDGRFGYRIGVGLAAGRIIAGEVGSKESRLDYAMFGEAFKSAEKLEAATKKFPEFPLLVDNEVASQNSGEHFNWIEEKVENRPVFRLSGISDSLRNLINSGESSFLESGKQKTKVQKLENTDENWLGRNQSFCRRLVCLTGAICIIFPALAGILTMYTTDRSTRERETRETVEQCKNALSKLHVADLEPALLEQYLDDLCESTSKEINWNKSGISAEQTKNQGEKIKRQLDAAGLKQQIFAVLHKPGDNTVAKPDDSWKIVNYQGNPDYGPLYCELLQTLLRTIFMPGWPDLPHVRSQMPLLMGSNMAISHIYLELYARLVPIQRSGVDEYFYWQPLMIRNQARIEKLTHVPRLDMRKHQQESADYILNNGAILCIFARSTADENQIEPLKNLLDRQKLSYAVVRSDNTIVAVTSPFAPKTVAYNSENSPAEGWYTISTTIRLGKSSYRVFIGKRLPQSRDNLKYLLVSLLLILFTLAALRVWRSAVYLETGIASKLAWQLWLGLFAAAIVPLAIVYTVNEWFAGGQIELRPVEERLKMLGELERIERRQFLQELVNWYGLEQITMSASLKEAADKIVNIKDPVESAAFNSAISSVIGQIGKQGIRTRHNDMLIFNHHGWQHNYVEPNSPVTNRDEFRRFLDFFVNDIFIELGMGKDTAPIENQSLSAGVKAEMTRDAGLEIFRNLFGSDAYFTLINGIGLKIDIFMASGHGLLSLMPTPNSFKPELLVFWLFFDNLNSQMQRIFSSITSYYHPFTESKVRYGSLKMSHNGGIETTPLYYARWAIATKMPISEQTTFLGKDCLVEARWSRQNEVMMVIGFIPVQYYLDEIENSRRHFLLLLALSVLAIVLLTMFVSYDITGPILALTYGAKKIASRQLEYRITDSRKDELGQMQNTFNTIARGLQEKELMGQMVSSSARRIAGDAKSLREAETGLHLEVSVLYLAVPQFSLFMQTLSHQELIAEVREHIDCLCHIIIKNGGEADKIMGEKVLAWFYSPDGERKSATMAAQAMKEIRDAERTGKLKFPVTAGVHNGEIIAGLLGFGSQRDFTIIGDPVNTAARICSRAAELPSERFLGSEAFVSSLSAGTGRYYDFGQVELKGKTESVNLKQIVF
jgi:class 3 adenylate cyclase